MRIGELAALAGERPATIRYYERRGLLPRPERTASGYRSYGPERVVQLRLIRWAQGVGFTLAEIRDLLGDVDSHARRPGPGVRARFRAKLHQVEGRLERLTAIRDQLDALASCRCRGRCPTLARAAGEPAVPPRKGRTRC